MNTLDNKKALNLLTIGFVVSLFFSIPGLIISIMAIIKAKKNNIKDITLGIIGVILSILKLLLIPIIVLIVMNFGNYKDIIKNDYDGTCGSNMDCTCNEFDEYCKCIKCYDDNCRYKLTITCPNKERNVF